MPWTRRWQFSFRGGIYSHGTPTIANTTIFDNDADKCGGGIWSEGTLAITNATVSGNDGWRPLIGDFDGPDDDDSQPNGQLSPAEIDAYFFA